MARLCALNLGCGPDYRESTEEVEWVNVDKGLCKKDYYLDIAKTPWLFWPSDGQQEPLSMYDCFDRIDAIQVLEHIPKEQFGRVVWEMFAASADGAEWNVAAPHGFSENFITDFTHQMPFSIRTFDYFVDGTDLKELGKIYGYEEVHLEHIEPPRIDGNQSVIFKLRVRKNG